ncbi:MAG: phosphoenolpyruvate--protein phosphotransferase [Spirochaetales bacterium]|nr:phosphoenolpyruvate--protein phosphotransferase [Spirochaetales bacterium]
MKEITGISASPGIVIGKVFYYIDDNITVPEYEIPQSEVEKEIERYKTAVGMAEQEILELKKNTSSNFVKEGRFLDSHILMLKDPDFSSKIVTGITEQKKNAEFILFKTARSYIKQFKAIDDPYLRERTVDIHDISRRVLNHLLYRERISLNDIQDEVILVTHNLMPSDAITMNKRMVKGIAMDAGGKTSHTAILARAFEIPAVLGLSDITSHVRSGDDVIIDGNSGKVIVQPDEKTRVQYEKILKEWQKKESELLTLNELPAETRDGKLIKLYANIEIAEETESAVVHGADGIGLYRSEFLMLEPGKYYSEDEQYSTYVSVLEEMGDKPVTIRTLDVGGDKFISEAGDLDEKNPLLGWRAIRYCLAHKDIFRIQIRALLRASAKGKLRIMFPMVSGVEEVDDLLEFLEEVKDELKEEGKNFDTNVPVGIMIEVPSAAVTTDILAGKVDFISIGTNDLIQYTTAVDRGNERVAYLYQPFHPAVLRLLRMIIDSAHAASIPVSMCGEMAGDPMAAVILLGLGLDGYSMSAFSIPEIKKIIRSTTMADAEEMVGTIMDMRSYKEIDKYVNKWMRGRFDFISL